jgi:mono/diheme cytochrome c family protein
MRRVLLAALLVAGCEMVGVPGPDLERMIDQARYEPMEASEFFSDGRASRPPPEGTAPWGRAEIFDGGVAVAPRAKAADPQVFNTGKRGGVYAEEIPVPLSRELVLRGRDRFDIYCAVCHGLAGDGWSRIAERMSIRKPPSLVDGRVEAMPPGRLYDVIASGYGLMPAYSHELAVEDRWAVVAYVKALGLSRGFPAAALPAELREEARARGELP